MAQQKLGIMQEETEPWSKQFGYWNYWNGKEKAVTWNSGGRDFKKKINKKTHHQNHILEWVEDALDWLLWLNFTYSIS